jgi:hypothetical protein
MLVTALTVALVAFVWTQPVQAHQAPHAGVKLHKHKHGPPPWAPAHGYRRKHAAGIDLIFDRNIGVYLITGHPRHYFYNGRFYRYRDNFWEASPYWAGPWGGIDLIGLPPGLRKHHAKQHLKHHRKHHRRHKHR